MRLICETLEDVEFICESTATGKNYFIEGVFMQANVKNRNGRVYPKAILEKEVLRYDQNYIKHQIPMIGLPIGEIVTA